MPEVEKEIENRVPTVGIIVFDNNNVLLIEHGKSSGHLTGNLGTPGGRIDEGETALKAAVRELKEETGLDVKEEDLVELPNKYKTDLPRKNGETLYVIHTVFTTKKFTGEIQETDEAIPEWVDINILKERDLMINTQDMIEKSQEVLNKHYE